MKTKPYPYQEWVVISALKDMANPQQVDSMSCFLMSVYVNEKHNKTCPKLLNLFVKKVSWSK